MSGVRRILALQGKPALPVYFSLSPRAPKLALKLSLARLFGSSWSRHAHAHQTLGPIIIWCECSLSRFFFSYHRVITLSTYKSSLNKEQARSTHWPDRRWGTERSWRWSHQTRLRWRCGISSAACSLAGRMWSLLGGIGEKRVKRRSWDSSEFACSGPRLYTYLSCVPGSGWASLRQL